jgi:hypothetical protein
MGAEACQSLAHRNQREPRAVGFAVATNRSVSLPRDQPLDLIEAHRVRCQAEFPRKIAEGEARRMAGASRVGCSR